MAYLGVQRLFQILQNGTAGYDTALQVFYAKALQCLHIKVLQQLLSGCLLREYPVIQFEGAVTSAKQTFEVLFVRAVIEHFLGLNVGEQLFDVIIGTFTTKKLTGRDVKETDTTCSLTKVNGCQEVILFVVQHGITHGHTWRHQLCNATLDEFLRQLGVFQLVTNGNTLTSPDELRQISIKRMMWKTRHLITLRTSSIVTLSQRNTQDT